MKRHFINGQQAYWGTYPLSLEQFHSVSDLMAFTAIDDNDVVGFFTMRRPTASFDELRFGFVIVDANKGGKAMENKCFS